MVQAGDVPGAGGAGGGRPVDARCASSRRLGNLDPAVGVNRADVQTVNALVASPGVDLQAVANLNALAQPAALTIRNLRGDDESSNVNHVLEDAGGADCGATGAVNAVVRRGLAAPADDAGAVLGRDAETGQAGAPSVGLGARGVEEHAGPGELDIVPTALQRQGV
ncbi:MAG: hypothetical protein MZV64_34635 [Ignavibacteriales bacterium]|nr:hypothetical protein [Ignavibacteriales bacterium]